MVPMPLSLPRVVLLIVICSLISTGLTLASAHKAPSSELSRVATPPAPKLVVPDVRGEAYVFAKGDLETAGFAWRLKGRTPGYAAMVVVGQSPTPGTVVLDTGYPILTLRLAKPAGYVPQGEPQQASSYPGTAVQLPPGTAVKTPRVLTAGGSAGARATTAARVATTAPKRRPTGKTAPASPARKRPPAFHVAGARPEPLDEMPLPDRARLLERWVATHPHPTAANQRHWLYQQAWIVTGARFGWWHGAAALRILIRVDGRIQALWGIGAKSETEARQALRFVEAHAG
jgi:hypothetical protein